MRYIAWALALSLLSTTTQAQITKVIPYDGAQVNFNNIPTLPATSILGLTCNASNSGQVFLASGLLLPTILGLIVGGGAITALVHCNGSIWVGG